LKRKIQWIQIPISNTILKEYQNTIENRDMAILYCHADEARQSHAFVNAGKARQSRKEKLY